MLWKPFDDEAELVREAHDRDGILGITLANQKRVNYRKLTFMNVLDVV